MLILQDSINSKEEHKEARERHGETSNINVIGREDTYGDQHKYYVSSTHRKPMSHQPAGNNDNIHHTCAEHPIQRWPSPVPTLPQSSHTSPRDPPDPAGELTSLPPSSPEACLSIDNTDLSSSSVRNSFSCSSALMREGMESVEEVAPLELA
jgi:hypothetical protein